MEIIEIESRYRVEKISTIKSWILEEINKSAKKKDTNGL